MKKFGKKHDIRFNPAASRKRENNICTNLSFTASEAYKLLRTNLMFTMPGDKKCRVVGISSSLPGEGKSITSINLAYTIAETGKRVLLISADMRLPSIAKHLGLDISPGLSNVLAGLCETDASIRKSGVIDNWFVMPAGEIPPNPLELLASEQMTDLLENLRNDYDFIIIDLPPINIVADALVLSDSVDGIIIVVRQGYANRQSLKQCMRQMECLKNKFLGFVMTSAKETTKYYGKYGKYKNRYETEQGKAGYDQAKN